MLPTDRPTESGAIGARHTRELPTTPQCGGYRSSSRLSSASSRRCLGEEYPEESLGRWSFEVLGMVKHGDLKDKPEAAGKVRATLKDPAKKLLWRRAARAGSRRRRRATARIVRTSSP